MPTYLAPGVFIEERSSGIKPIEGVSTSVAAFIGVTARGPVARAVLVTSAAEFLKIFGDPIPVTSSARHYLGYAVLNFFAMGGTKCYVVRVVHYADINDTTALTGTATPATTAGTPFTSALQITAINPGTWGSKILEVQAFPSSRFSVRLAEAVTASPPDLTAITLVENSDVRVGSLLWVIEEVTGVVAAVATGNNVSFVGGWAKGGAAFTSGVVAGVSTFTPDFGLVTTTAAAGDATAGIQLTSVIRADGTTLKRGDVITFAVKEHL